MTKDATASRPVTNNAGQRLSIWAATATTGALILSAGTPIARIADNGMRRRRRTVAVRVHPTIG